LPRFSKSLIAENELLLSPMVMLELQYLLEIRRLTVPPATIVDTLGRAARLRICDLPFAGVARAALGETWTRDPFDRIIVAHARLRELPLLTKDRVIRAHYERAIWARPRSG
jgi:PIN domain nuclease of toxin-antitoxin system